MTEREIMNEQTTAKRERLELRVSAEQKALFQRAAEIQGRSLTDFVAGSLLAAAEAVIRQQSVITLSARDSELFADALLNPSPPSDRLRAAAARYLQRRSEP